MKSAQVCLNQKRRAAAWLTDYLYCLSKLYGCLLQAWNGFPAPPGPFFEFQMADSEIELFET